MPADRRSVDLRALDAAFHDGKYHHENLVKKVRVMVIGATGHVGLEVVRRLSREQQTFDIEVAVRDIGKAKTIFPGVPVSYVYFDFDDPSSFDKALRGVDRIFWVMKESNQAYSQAMAFIPALAASSVEHVVYTSVMLAGQNTLRLCRFHFQIEQTIKKAGVRTTILRCANFMQLFAGYSVGIEDSIRQSRICPVPLGENAHPFVDIRDVAEVAAKVLSPSWKASSASAHEHLTLTGPVALTGTNIAAIISMFVSPPVTYFDTPEQAYHDTLFARGYDEETSTAHMEWKAFVKSGKANIVSDDVVKVLGRKARPFELFANDHSYLWK